MLEKVHGPSRIPRNRRELTQVSMSYREGEVKRGQCLWKCSDDRILRVRVSFYSRGQNARGLASKDALWIRCTKSPPTAASFHCPRAPRCGSATHNGPSYRTAPECA